MNQSTQSYTVAIDCTATQGGRATAADPQPLHPHDTSNLPYPGYLGESVGRRVDPDASYANDATGRIPMELATPNVEKRIDGPFDVDWFSIVLAAGRSYAFHIRGAATDDGTLEDPAFGGFWFDPDGDDLELQELSGHQHTDGRHGTNTVLTFAPTRTGTCYFAAIAQNRGLQSATGSYSVEVYDSTDDAAAGRHA